MPKHLQLDHPLVNRKRLYAIHTDIKQISEDIRALLESQDDTELEELLSLIHPADLADVMLYLTPKESATVFGLLDHVEAAEVLDEVDDKTEMNLVQSTSDDKLAEILNELPADEGADVVGTLPTADAYRILALTDDDTATEIRTLLAYPPETAGGIMSLGFIDVREDFTQLQAIQKFHEKPDAEHIFYVYVVDEHGSLKGAVDLLDLLRAEPTTLMREIMTTDVLSVPHSYDQEQVAHIFARYDLTALSVVSDTPDHRLLGVITANDIIDVIQEESAEDIAMMSGSDAEELENKTPVQVAMLRMPWLLGTLFIELLAGVVIHVFDDTLAKFILLASFMPIISAISGNTGLQSAAIIIRGLSTGHVQLAQWRHAVERQLVTTVILGGACAVILGVIGAIWDRSYIFGITVFLGMFIAVNIAGVVGTVVPLLSKRAGFDPALTAGPFETAFQDVIGISVFLALAASLLHVFK